MARQFCPGSTIVGIDIYPKCKQHETENIEIHIGSQNDPEFLTKTADLYGEFDILLDDGSHVNENGITTFDNLYDSVADNGVYLVGDMHTSYGPKWGGGLHKESSFIEFAKPKIGELNATHVRGDYPITDFTCATDSMSFFDSIVVFEKRRQGTRQHAITTKMP